MSNSRFKFRVWDKEDDKWRDPFGEIWDFQEMISKPERFVVQQFIGIYDRNSLPIFEGDIVHFDDSKISGKPTIGDAEVFFCEDLTLSDSPCFALWFLAPKGGFYKHFLGDIEVIGNIFDKKSPENPASKN